MKTLTPEFFNALILIVIIVGLVIAGIRFYRDMVRPLPPQHDDYEDYLRMLQEDTQPGKERSS